MKRIFTFILFILTLNFAVFSQVPNASFENLDSTNTLENWIFTGTTSVTIGDSIGVDSTLISASTDAHTGLYALELRNSYNYTASIPFMNGTVSVTLPDSTMYLGFNKFLPLSSRPYSLSFFYKFALNPFNDSTIGTIKIFNSVMEEIGMGSTIFGDIQANYQSREAVIDYLPLSAIGLGDSIPAFYSIEFKNVVNPSTTDVGQRTLIDDVAIQYGNLSVEQYPNESEVYFFPNPAVNYIAWTGKPNVKVEFYNLFGSLIGNTSENHFDVSNFPSGIYFAKFYYNQSIVSKMFTKE